MGEWKGSQCLQTSVEARWTPRGPLVSCWPLSGARTWGTY